MKKSNWFGYIIYSKSVDEIDEKWEECKALEKEFQSIEFHKQYYEAVRFKLINEKNNRLNSKHLILFDSKNLRK